MVASVAEVTATPCVEVAATATEGAVVEASRAARMAKVLVLGGGATESA